jgi:hypothetical protein
VHGAWSAHNWPVILAEARFADLDAEFLLDLRGWLARSLQGWAPDLVRDVTVVLGELTANAFRHAGPPFAVRVSVAAAGHALRVEVHDGSAAHTADWTFGRGLLVVRDLCRGWGVERSADGKITWAEVPVPSLSRQASRVSPPR